MRALAASLTILSSPVLEMTFGSLTERVGSWSTMLKNGIPMVGRLSGSRWLSLMPIPPCLPAGEIHQRQLPQATLEVDLFGPITSVEFGTSMKKLLVNSPTLQAREILPKLILMLRHLLPRLVMVWFWTEPMIMLIWVAMSQIRLVLIWLAFG